MQSQTAITVYQQLPAMLATVEKLGLAIAKSGMFGADTEAKGQIIAFTCITEGMSPVQFREKYHLANSGALTMRADYMLAEFRKIGGKCQWLSDIQSDKEAFAHFTFKENDGNFKYTIEDAKREGLISKDVWKKSTPDMLRARLISKTLRMIAPEIVSGNYTEEEILAGPSELDASQVSTQPSPTSAPQLPAPVEALASAIEATAPTSAAEIGASKVVDAEVIPAQAAPSPSATKDEQKPAPPSTRPTSADEPADLKARLAELLKPYDKDKVNAFFVSKGHIKPGQTTEDLNPEVVRLAIARWASISQQLNS